MHFLSISKYLWQLIKFPGNHCKVCLLSQQQDALCRSILQLQHIHISLSKTTSPRNQTSIVHWVFRNICSHTILQLHPQSHKLLSDHNIFSKLDPYWFSFWDHDYNLEYSPLEVSSFLVPSMLWNLSQLDHTLKRNWRLIQ